MAGYVTYTVNASPLKFMDGGDDFLARKVDILQNLGLGHIGIE